MLELNQQDEGTQPDAAPAGDQPAETPVSEPAAPEAPGAPEAPAAPEAPEAVPPADGGEDTPA